MKNKNKPLSLKRIRKFNPEERFFKPDWDDNAIEFDFGLIKLTGYTVLNNTNCKTDALEGMNGLIYIETVNELEKISSFKKNSELFGFIVEAHPDLSMKKIINIFEEEGYEL